MHIFGGVKNPRRIKTFQSLALVLFIPTTENFPVSVVGKSNPTWRGILKEYRARAS